MIKDISIDGYTRDAQGFALRVRNKIETDTSIVTYPLSPLLLHNHVYKLYTIDYAMYTIMYTRIITYSILVCGSVLRFNVFGKCGRPPILVLDLD